MIKIVGRPKRKGYRLSFILVYGHGTRNSSSLFDKKSAPWMFAMDHTDYPRWLPIFIHDLKSLQSNHPGVYKESCQGRFTISKSGKPFSSMIGRRNKTINSLK